MMTATLAGAYACKRHGTLHSYDATWEATERTVFWIAKINFNRRLATPGGTITFQPGSDPGGLVRSKIASYIDQSVCPAGCPPTLS
jgi:hypothetical protein